MFGGSYKVINLHIDDPCSSLPVDGTLDLVVNTTGIDLTIPDMGYGPITVVDILALVRPEYQLCPNLNVYLLTPSHPNVF